MSEPPKTIATSRLKLRPPMIEDASSIFEQYSQDKKVTKYMTWKPHDNVEITRQFLKHCIDSLIQKTDCFWVILPKQEAKAIGMIRLQLHGYHASLGYVLARPYWNQGLMTEAIQVLVDWTLNQPNIYRIWAVCDLENIASARVLEKVGMIREGILRRWLIHPNMSNEPRDCLCYAKVK